MQTWLECTPKEWLTERCSVFKHGCGVQCQSFILGNAMATNLQIWHSVSKTDWKQIWIRKNDWKLTTLTNVAECFFVSSRRLICCISVPVLTLFGQATPHCFDYPTLMQCKAVCSSGELQRVTTMLFVVWWVFFNRLITSGMVCSPYIGFCMPIKCHRHWTHNASFGYWW